MHSCIKRRQEHLPASFFNYITFSVISERRPGDHDMFHSSGRHDVPDEVSCTAGMLPIVVKSGGDVNASHPDVHVKHVVLVMLP